MSRLQRLHRSIYAKFLLHLVLCCKSLAEECTPKAGNGNQNLGEQFNIPNKESSWERLMPAIGVELRGGCIPPNAADE